MDKQQLLAAALAVTAFAAPQFAQAQEKIVSFYGLLDVNLAHEKAGKLSRTGLDHSELNGTRFGVKGSAPLAGTMKAVYVLEGGFDTGTGKSEQSSTLLGRQVYAGIEGAYGRLTAGRQYSPAFVAIDPFEATGGADRSAGMLHRKSGSVKRGYEVRFDNMIKYRSPEFAGFSVDLGYWTGKENSSDNSEVRNEGSGNGIAALYKSGALSGSLVSQTYYTNQTGGKAATHGGALAYDFGLLKAFALYTEDHESGTQGTGKARSYSVGAELPLSAEDTVTLAFGSRDERGEAAAEDATGASVYYLRALGKDTTAYAGYSRLDNRSTADYGWNLTPAAGTDPAVLMVGMRQRF